MIYFCDFRLLKVDRLEMILNDKTPLLHRGEAVIESKRSRYLSISLISRSSKLLYFTYLHLTLINKCIVSLISLEIDYSSVGIAFGRLSNDSIVI